MGRTGELGRRVELVSMDSHFHSISVGLYRREDTDGPAYLVHTYSAKPGADDRMVFLKRAMQVLGGMVETREGLLRFPCGNGHGLAVKRVFLEACKLDPSAPPVVRPLAITDRRSGLKIEVTGLGEGVYEVAAAEDAQGADRRVRAIAGGLLKLGEMVPVAARDSAVAFECGTSHDAMVGLILVRAPNVRAVMREHEQAATRGVLSAPSAQSN